MNDRGVMEIGKREIDPAEEKAYREMIASARKGGSAETLKGRERVGVVPKPKMPQAAELYTKQQASALTPEGGVQPRPPGSPVLRDETRQQLEGFAEAAKAAAEEAKVKVEEEKKKEVEVEDLLSAFDFGGMSEADRILNNKKRREEIEKRCAPMDINDLLYKNEVRQVVPIIPEKFEVTYRTATPEESLFIKDQIGAEQNSTKHNEAWLQEKLTLCQLTLGLVAINGEPLPPHVDQNGDPDEKKFAQKLKIVTKKSGYVVADLSVNYAWFDLRVRKLFTPDALKNG